MGFGYLMKKQKIKNGIKNIVKQFEGLEYVEELSSWDSGTPRFTAWLKDDKNKVVINLYGDCDEEPIFDEFEITVKMVDNYASWDFDMKFGVEEIPKILEQVEKFKTFINEFLEEFNNKGVKE